MRIQQLHQWHDVSFLTDHPQLRLEVIERKVKRSVAERPRAGGSDVMVREDEAVASPCAPWETGEHGFQRPTQPRPHSVHGIPPINRAPNGPATAIGSRCHTLTASANAP